MGCSSSTSAAADSSPAQKEPASPPATEEGSVPDDTGTTPAAGSPLGTSTAPQPPEEPAGPPAERERPAPDNAGKSIYELYDFGRRRKLGEGCSATVWKATHRESGLVYAVKSISKSCLKSAEICRHEVAIMRAMDHPHIVKLHETYEDHRLIYLVMELCTGGELFCRIVESGRFTEVAAAYLMQQILGTLCYMHENNICHRDLKPENFLFKEKDRLEQSHLKVIDFDCSRRVKPGEGLQTRAPVSFCVAPEALKGSCTQLCDMWSCGVIMYIMLCGYPPFYGETDTELQRKVAVAKLAFDASDWRKVSKDAQNLVRRLLQREPGDRYTAEQALGDIWITGRAPNGKSVQLDAGFIDRLRGFGRVPRLQKAAARIIASQLSEKEISELTASFKALDRNSDGQLTAAEVKEGIGRAGLTGIPGDLQQLLDHVDTDRSGTIDLSEFITASIAERRDLLERDCWAAFRAFDKDGDGVISAEELGQVLAGDCSSDGDKEKAVGDIMEEFDVRGGQIDFETFMKSVLRVDAKGHQVHLAL